MKLHFFTYFYLVFILFVVDFGVRELKNEKNFSKKSKKLFFQSLFNIIQILVYQFYFVQEIINIKSHFHNITTKTARYTIIF
uniref:Uncharacterized protein n=1 Tax=Bacteriophage sp. TaxID=38018 RepID=A0A8D9UHP7_9VIRU|nr:MAG TPA: hypothetical protein [Bacteriophage sp.]